MAKRKSTKGNQRSTKHTHKTKDWNCCDCGYFCFSFYYQLKAGDVSSRKKIRQENNCKPFKYFLDHVREIIHLYVPENLKASGTVSTNTQ